MIVLLSPSKTLDMDTPAPPLGPTQPALLEQTERLVKRLRRLSVPQLQELMDISPKLAALNHERFRRFATPFTPSNAKPCLFAFRGDVYDGFDADSLSAAGLAYAQAHLRILSGLYGLLRPCDLMQPYRLEMGTTLDMPGHKNVYGFWGTRIAECIAQAAAEAGSRIVLNLASQEYAKAVDVRALQLPLIEAQFKERRGNKLQTIGLLAKKARGRMARWVIERRAADPQALRDFREDGYRFDETLSDAHRLIFVRAS